MTNRALNEWFNSIVKRPTFAVTLSVLWLILIGWVAYGWNLGSVGLIDETEPLFAEASRQMLVTGDWITPYFDGATRFDKPALVYWCQAIAYTIFGVNEWAVRLPSAFAAFGLICLIFYTLSWYFNRQDYLENIFRPSRRYFIAALGAALVAFTPEMIVWGRTGVSDMLLTGCIASALLCFFLGYAQPHQPKVQGRWYLGFYVLISGAILDKGPVGIVLPGLIIAAFTLYLGNFWQVLREMRIFLGLVIISALSVPWYVLVTLRNPDTYIKSFFGFHNLERFTSVVVDFTVPWYFYFFVVLLGFAPYSIYLPTAIVRLKFWHFSHWRTQERSNQLGLFAFFWFISVFGFFTIAVTKLPSYVLPLMPAAAILVAVLWGDLLKQQSAPTSGSLLYWSGWINVIFVSALAAALFYVPQLLGFDPAAPDFDKVLQKSGISVVGGIIWLICAIVLAFLLLRRRWRFLIGVNLLAFAAFVIFVLMPALFLMDEQRQLPLRQLSAIAVQTQKPGEQLIMVGFEKPSVVFYTHRNITFLKLTAQGAEYFKEQAAKNPHPDSVLMITQSPKLAKMGLQPNRYENIADRGAYDLVRVPLK